MFVSGLCGLASLPFHPQWPSSFQYFSVPVSSLWAVQHVSQISVNNYPPLSLLQVIFCQYSPKTVFLYRGVPVHVLNLLNGALHHQYIISALKIIIYNNIICFHLQTSEMHVKLDKM